MSVEHLNYCGTRIDAPATFRGISGEAWRVNLAPLGQREAPDHDATVAIYLVHALGAHPLWDHYMVTVIHLRPIAGVKPAHIRLAGATHEFMIASLNPEKPLPSLEGGPGWHVDFLRPIDVVEQFAAADDVVADTILELAVRAIVDGYASPDQDWRGWWTGAVANTAEHFKDGTHSLGSRS